MLPERGIGQNKLDQQLKDGCVPTFEDMRQRKSLFVAQYCLDHRNTAQVRWVRDARFLSPLLCYIIPIRILKRLDIFRLRVYCFNPII